jgi:hypothetical protein
VIDASLAGTAQLFAVTPIFFIGATSGVALAHVLAYRGR